MNPNINEVNKTNEIAGSLEIMVIPKEDELCLCEVLMVVNYNEGN